jgi:hypothetical protein
MNNTEILQLIEKYNSGLTFKQIGKEIGKSGEFVRVLLKKNGVFPRDHKLRRKELTLDQEKSIIGKYFLCVSHSEIAKDYGIGEALVYKTLKRHNIDANIFRIKETIQKEICKKYLNGNSTFTIQKEYDVSKSCILTILRRNNIEVKPIDIARKIFFPNRNYFEKIDSEIKAYVFGLLLSDGCIHKGRTHLALQKCDEYILELILKEVFEKECPSIYHGEKRGVNISSIVFSDKKIYASLQKLGMTERKSLTLKYPYEAVPSNYFGDFLRGYFDGDGCIYLNEKNRAMSFIITGGSIDFLKSLKEEVEKRI